MSWLLVAYLYISEFSPGIEQIALGSYVSSDACKDALDQQLNDSTLTDELGKPIEYDFNQNIYGGWHAYYKSGDDENGLSCICIVDDPDKTTLANEGCLRLLQ